MLTWFRRHAKILMVVLGSSAMVIFGFGSAIETLMRPDNSTSAVNEVVATWKGGNITDAQLGIMEKRHFQSLRFLQGVQAAAKEKKGGEITPLAFIITPISEGQRELVQRQLVDRMLLAERAREEGMIVSDGMVDDYIAMVSGDAEFSNRDLEAINQVENNRRCSLQVLKEYLKMEMLVNQMNKCTYTSNYLPPNLTESMELFGRTTEQVECEVIPVDVEQFLAKVSASSKATPAELKSLFEEGKHRFPDLTGKKPGFKVGRKVKIQYLVANYNTFLQNELNKLTDEDVQTEYERLVKAEDPIVMEPITPKDDSFDLGDGGMDLPGDVPAPPKEGSESGDTKSEAPADIDLPPDVDLPPGDDSAPESEMKKSDSDKGGKPDPSADKDMESETKKTADPAPAVTPETKTEKAESNSEPAKEPGKTPTENDAKESGKLSIDQNAQLQFVSFSSQDPTPNDEQETKQNPSQPTEPAKQGENTTPVEASNKQPSPPADAQPENKTDQVPAAEKKSDPDTDAIQDPKPEIDTPPSDEDTIKPALPAGLPAALQDDKIERQVKPLKDVVDAVKRNMCNQSTTDAMEKALSRANTMVMVHFQERLAYEAGPVSGRTVEPDALDYEAIAKQYKLEANETGLVDFPELAKTRLGQINFFFNQPNQQPRLIPIANMIFGGFGRISLYEPETINDSFGSRSGFIFWTTEKAETRVPTFEESKGEVEIFWQNQKALELATKEAKSIQARSAANPDKKLSELFSERANPTGAFTWFNSFGDTSISSPFGVTDAGNDFMHVAFGLEKMGTGIASNNTQKIVYVIQSISGAEPTSVYGDNYLENQIFTFNRVPAEVNRVAGWYGDQVKQEWYDNFHEEMELKFVDR